jgi:hypothetical protein
VKPSKDSYLWSHSSPLTITVSVVASGWVITTGSGSAGTAYKIVVEISKNANKINDLIVLFFI